MDANPSWGPKEEIGRFARLGWMAGFADGLFLAWGFWTVVAAIVGSWGGAEFLFPGGLCWRSYAARAACAQMLPWPFEGTHVPALACRCKSVFYYQKLVMLVRYGRCVCTKEEMSKNRTWIVHSVLGIGVQDPTGAWLGFLYAYPSTRVDADIV